MRLTDVFLTLPTELRDLLYNAFYARACNEPDRKRANFYLDLCTDIICADLEDPNYFTGS